VRGPYSVVVETSVGGYGTIRCNLLPVLDWHSKVCDSTETLFCESLLSSSSVELQTFMNLNLEQKTLSSHGLNQGAAGTVCYSQFTTGSDVTTVQEHGRDLGSGVVFE